MSDGPFTDDDIRQMLAVHQTQAGIQKYIEGMAQVLAEAGRASNKAIGDRPETAVNKWIEVLRKRAYELLKEDSKQPQIEKPVKRIEG